MTSDLAALIAQTICETKPWRRSPEATRAWALRTWPGCTHEMATRAVAIALELTCFDFATQDLE